MRKRKRKTRLGIKKEEEKERLEIYTKQVFFFNLIMKRKKNRFKVF